MLLSHADRPKAKPALPGLLTLSVPGNEVSSAAPSPLSPAFGFDWAMGSTESGFPADDSRSFSQRSASGRRHGSHAPSVRRLVGATSFPDLRGVDVPIVAGGGAGAVTAHAGASGSGSASAGGASSSKPPSPTAAEMLARLAVLSEQHNMLLAQYDVLCLRHAEARHLNGELQSVAEDLLADVHKLRERQATLEAQNDNLRRLCASTARNNRELRSHRVVMARENDAIRTSYSVIAGENVRLRRELTEHRRELTEHRTLLNEHRRQLSEQHNTYSKLYKRYELVSATSDEQRIMTEVLEDRLHTQRRTIVGSMRAGLRRIRDFLKPNHEPNASKGDDPYDRYYYHY